MHGFEKVKKVKVPNNKYGSFYRDSIQAALEQVHPDHKREVQMVKRANLAAQAEQVAQVEQVVVHQLDRTLKLQRIPNWLRKLKTINSWRQLYPQNPVLVWFVVQQ